MEEDNACSNLSDQKDSDTPNTENLPEVTKKKPYCPQCEVCFPESESQDTIESIMNSKVENIKAKELEDKSCLIASADETLNSGTLSEHKKQLGDLILEYVSQKQEFIDSDLEKNINISNDSGNTPLLIAAMTGHTDSVMFLANHRADLNWRNQDGNTALHLSAKYGQVSTVRYLLECGFDVNSENKYHNTPLILASAYGHVEVIHHLVKYGASVNHIGSDGYSALHWVSLFENVPVIQCLLKLDVDVNVLTSYGNTPLILASCCGHLETVKLLVEHGASVNIANKCGYTALHMSARDGRLDTVAYLLEAGHYVDPKNNANDTPLIEAANNGHVDVAKLLLKCGANVNAKGRDDMTPLSRHSLCGNDQDTLYGLRTGDWCMPTVQRCYSPCLEMVQLLIQNGACVNVVNYLNYSVLSSFLLFGCRDVSIVRYLLECGAEIHSRNIYGCTPLLFSVGKPDIMKVLVVSGANVNDVSNDGDTALHRCVKLNYLMSAKILVERGVNVNTKNKNGETPIYYSHNEDMLKLLINNGAFLDITNDLGQTVLHVFVKMRNLKFVKVLIENGCSVNVKDNDGNTPLILASPRIMPTATVAYENVTIIRIKEDGEDFVLNGPSTWLETINNEDDDEYVNIKNVTNLNLENFESTELKLEDKSCLIAVVDETYSHTGTLSEHKKQLSDLILEYISRKQEFVVSNPEKNINISNDSGNTPLLIAAMTGHIDSVMFLANHGADLNWRNQDGNTALHLSAKYGQVSTVRYLLECGFDVNSENKYHNTPFILASAYGHVEVIHHLVKYGASVNHIGSDGYSALHWVSQRDNVPVIQCLLNLDVDVNVLNSSGNTPLILASCCGHLEMVKLLVENGASVNISNKCGYTALHMSARDGRLDTVAYLLEAGHYVDPKNNANDTPLIEAANNGHVDVAKLLLKYGANVNAKGRDDMTPLSRHSLCGNDQDTLYGLRTGDWCMPIVRRCYSPCLEMVQLLIQNGACVNAVDNLNYSVLNSFSLFGCRDVSIIQYLLECGADIHSRNVYDSTPLLFSIGKPDIMKLLVESGANVNDVNDDGETALHRCAELSYLTSAEFLVEQGANVNAKNKKGETPVFYCHNEDMLKFLIKNGAFLNITNDLGQTVLHMFVKMGNLKCVKVLIENGCSVNVEDNDGNTPLILASQRVIPTVTVGILKLLIENGSCINSVNNKGLTSLHYATKCKHSDMIVKLLIREMVLNVMLNIKKITNI